MADILGTEGAILAATQIRRTLTAIAIGGTATGLTSQCVVLEHDQSITITYSVAPTLTWYGS